MPASKLWATASCTNSSTWRAEALTCRSVSSLERQTSDMCERSMSWSSLRPPATALAFKVFQLHLPCVRNVSRRISAFQSLQSVGIDQQAKVAINLPLRRVQLVQCHSNFQPAQHRAKPAAIGDDDVDAATLLAF